MPAKTFLDAFPLPVLFGAIALLVLVSIEVGYRLGRFRRSQPGHEAEAPVGAMVGSTLGLLAFLLAFTFGMAASRFDTRRQAVLDEANSIGTTYLRAGMLPGLRTEIRTLLRDYVDARLEAVETGNIADGIRRSEELQARIWEHAVTLAEQNPNSIIVGLFVESLNETIDIHTKRVTAGLRSRIPAIIWTGLGLITVIALTAMGYHAGLTGTARSLATPAVAFTFAVVIALIADLDRPREGALKVSQQALVDLRQSMHAPQP